MKVVSVFSVLSYGDEGLKRTPKEIFDHLSDVAKNSEFQSFEIWWDSFNNSRLLIGISTTRQYYICAVWRQ